MADKKVNLIISLKDGVSSGLAGIRNGISATATAFKKIAVAGVGATTVIIGGLTALAKAYAGQETANKKMAATFKALGENGEQAVKKWGKFATAIQRTTTLGDEEVMGLVTLAKTMGVANDRIESVTKGAIGLSKAFGLDLNSAMKMSVLAMNGEYEMLGRYIPALRSATTESEKAAIVQKAMAAGFDVAKAELGTIAGAWTALKGVIGDAMETAGEAIFGGGGLATGLKRVKERIIELTENGTITKWAEQAKAGLLAVVETIKMIANTSTRDKALENVAAILKAGFIQASQAAIDLFLKYAPRIGAAIGDAARSLISGFKQDKMTGAQKKSAEDAAFQGKKGLFQVADKDIYNQKKREFEDANRAARLNQGESDYQSAFGSPLKGALSENKAMRDTANKRNTGSGFAMMAGKMVPISDILNKGNTVNGQPWDGSTGGQSASFNGKPVDVNSIIGQQNSASFNGKPVDVNSIIGGAVGGKVASAVSGATGSETTGKLMSGGGLSSPADKTNALLEEQNGILKERLGGVKE